MNQSKLTDLTVENILSTGVSVKMQITDSISENLTNSDLESIVKIDIKSFSVYIIIREFITFLHAFHVYYVFDVIYVEAIKLHIILHPWFTEKKCL